MRTRLKLGALLLQLLAFCGHDSESCREFRNVIEVSASLKRRVVELKKAGNLYEVFLGPESGLEHLAHAGLNFVVTKKTERMFVPWKNHTEEGIAVSAQLETNYARMAIERQAEWG
ncbi:uncharacterized protein PITG_23023 [Phytophthora infestans T30-4]|uniref:Secreted RxLR effector peptide protein n=1 Tax=Phytophthora infestans (strain T30-4) TaxID=403677 RepID=D0NQJ1_PHYIT|nr:uncharacterized protein PITG_23022 [Phytophthora infestans T30-4]XP_002898463.1 uncharacterized protein PITG_23023 [Phytophthora infestans T30-4]EEY62939.1 conserved hypothetical protein [Phytophthora infestans T30-4]EEY62940.1 conserved hypothetical protein [Phytophthora infestans T30-4]|eukprot:XP_002898462.1 conserved hypothetical protein [Phytophthora infestans T30-4]